MQLISGINQQDGCPIHILIQFKHKCWAKEVRIGTLLTNFLNLAMKCQQFEDWKSKVTMVKNSMKWKLILTKIWKKLSKVFLEKRNKNKNRRWKHAQSSVIWLLGNLCTWLWKLMTIWSRSSLPCNSSISLTTSSNCKSCRSSSLRMRFFQWAPIVGSWKWCVML